MPDGTRIVFDGLLRKDRGKHIIEVRKGRRCERIPSNFCVPAGATVGEGRQAGLGPEHFPYCLYSML